MRAAQRTLRLDCAPPEVQWRIGAPLAYLGTAVTLALGAHDEAVLVDGALQLPLPPNASPRQIQDAAQAWLQRQAARHVSATLQALAARLNCPPPRWSLSFAARADWVHVDERGVLRCHWRLIELAPADIELALARSLKTLLPDFSKARDLFARTAASATPAR